MTKEEKELLAKKVLCIFSLFIYFFSSFGNAVVAQINLSFTSSLQRKFNSAQDMLNYTAKLSPQDQFELYNASTIACTRSGEMIFDTENKTAYKFSCFVKNTQSVNLQLTLSVLNAGKGGYDFLGYVSSNEDAIRFDGFASNNMKFTIFNNSRTLFNLIIATASVPGINVDSNQGKIIFTNDENEFQDFIQSLHSLESLLFLQNAYEQINGVKSSFSYTLANVSSSDSSAESIILSLNSFDIFNILSGQTIQKSLEFANYSVVFNPSSNLIEAKIGNQVVGTAVPTIEIVPVYLNSTLNAGNASLAGIVANQNSSFNFATNYSLINQSISGQFTKVTGEISLADVANGWNNFWANIFGIKKSQTGTANQNPSGTSSGTKFELIFYQQNGGEIQTDTGRLINAIYAENPSYNSFDNIDSLIQKIVELSKTDSTTPLIAERNFGIIDDSANGSIVIVDTSPSVRRYSGQVSMFQQSDVLKKFVTDDGKTIDLTDGKVIGEIVTTTGSYEIDFQDIDGIASTYANGVYLSANGNYVISTTTFGKINIISGKYRLLETSETGAQNLKNTADNSQTAYLKIDSNNNIVGYSGSDARIVSGNQFTQESISKINFEGPPTVSNPPSESDLQTALNKVKNGQSFTDTDAETIIQKAIYNFRAAIANRNSIKILSSSCMFGGCSIAQSDIARRITNLAGTKAELYIQDTHDLFVPYSNPSYEPSLPYHAFLVVKFSDTGKSYLIDPTFGQFFIYNPNGYVDADGSHGLGFDGYYIRNVLKEGDIADKLISNGYLELNSQTAQLYSKGLSEGRAALEVQDYIKISTMEVEYTSDELNKAFGTLGETSGTSSGTEISFSPEFQKIIDNEQSWKASFKEPASKATSLDEIYKNLIVDQCADSAGCVAGRQGAYEGSQQSLLALKSQVTN